MRIVTFFLLSLGFAASARAASDDKAFGAPLPPGADKQSEEGRYRVPRAFDDVIEYYEKLYKNNANYRFKAIVSAPNVKAIHLQNVRGSSGHDSWAGINIYQIGSSVGLFVLKSDTPPPKPAAAPPPTARRKK